MKSEALDHFTSFISCIIDRPGMFGVGNVNDLSFIFLGYCYSQSSDVDEVQAFVSGFRTFVNIHYSTNDNYDWYKLIILHSGSGLHSIQLFGDLFRRYLSNLNLPGTN